MPRGDRTGPRGLGPMTGRGMGYCSKYPVSEIKKTFRGYGRGCGRGRGLGRRTSDY